MNDTNTTKPLIVFFDAIGRTIIAKQLNEDDSTITVENPAVVNISPQEVIDQTTGQKVQRMALQLFPLFFREFLAAKNESIKFNFKKHNITMSEGVVELDFKVGVQYDQLFATVSETIAKPVTQPIQPIQQPTQQNDITQNNNVIKLFDD